MLSLKNLTVKAADKEILHDISIDFASKKIYAIMGTNGSGKSTLARTIMGDPSLTIADGAILIDGDDIGDLAPHKRAHRGIFLSPQSPLAIPGVTVQQLLRAAISREKTNSKDLSAKIKKVAQDLSIDPELLTRSLNENFSGGERKKMEMLQATILDPKYIILDEIDTGVDVDALKIIANQIVTLTKDTEKCAIIITHYNRILSQLPVDDVFIMRDGKIVDQGKKDLAQKIEEQGYVS